MFNAGRYSLCLKMLNKSIHFHWYSVPLTLIALWGVDKFALDFEICESTRSKSRVRAWFVRLFAKYRRYIGRKPVWYGLKDFYFKKKGRGGRGKDKVPWIKTSEKVYKGVGVSWIFIKLLFYIYNMSRYSSQRHTKRNCYPHSDISSIRWCKNCNQPNYTWYNNSPHSCDQICTKHWYPSCVDDV